MFDGMQIDVAELAGVAVEGILYGVFLVMDVVALYILVRRSNYRRSMNKPMIFAAVIMLLLSTAQFAVDTTNIFLGFITTPDRLGRLAFFIDLKNPIFAAKHAIYFTMMVVGDIIVIYRCYLVWGRKLMVVIFPMMCSLGSAACAYQTIWAIRHDNFNPVLEFNMGYPIFSLSFAANAISTCLIAYKIWMADRQFKQTSSRSFGRRSLFPIAMVIIESGAINTAYLLAYTIVLRSGSNAIEIMASIVTPLVGIIFAMVIIRAALAADREEADMTTVKNQVPLGPMFPQPTNSTTHEGGVRWMVGTTTEASSADMTAESKRFEETKFSAV